MNNYDTTCEACGGTMEGRRAGALTCGDSCRQRLSRNIREARKAGTPEAVIVEYLLDAKARHLSRSTSGGTAAA